MTSPITVSALYYYPIKSCGGIQVERALLTRRGLQDDRLLMLVDDAGLFLTQRELPRMALIAPELIPATCGDILTLRAPGMEPISLQLTDSGERRNVVVWRDQCLAVDQGDEAARWLSAFLGQVVRLVRMADEFQRPLDPHYRRGEEDETGFSDGYPVLLIAQASLDDLNGRLAEPLPMNRFRPNIVVSGCPPFAEDGWQRIRIGSVELSLVKPCARCAITTTDQATALVGKEPLTTLATYRRIDGKVMFGQNLIGHSVGLIQVGDQVVPTA